jgi:dihydrofolate synthase/folylpolyglutamate synthase
MNYAEALAWIYSFSDTERTGQFTRDREDNLRRERTLLAALGAPQRAYGITHVAGTKGKGSTSAMIASIVQAAGLRTGLYSQPDLHTFRERMRVDGAVVPSEEIAQLAPLVRDALEHVGTPPQMYITYEVATALAFLCFREAGARHAVIEVGLGGRLDATNVVEPLVSVITSISYDHMSVLGDTLGAIAGEKAGIIKPGVPVVCSAQAPEALDVIERVSAERGSQLVCVGPAEAPDALDTTGVSYRYRARSATSEGQTFDIETPSGVYRDVELPLLGEHQIENAAAAVAAAELLTQAGLPVDETAIRRGLREVRWPARMQVVRRQPWVIVDGAHNADSFNKLFAGLRRHFTFERMTLVLAVMADKDLAGIGQQIEAADVSRVVVTAVAHPRAARPAELAALLRERMPGAVTTVAADTGAALAEALNAADPQDLIVVAGSLYLAGEALRWLAARPEQAGQTTSAIEIAGVDH